MATMMATATAMEVATATALATAAMVGAMATAMEGTMAMRRRHGGNGRSNLRLISIKGHIIFK